LQSGSCGAGELVRYERQVRWEKKREPSMDEALRLRLGDLYAKPLRQFRGDLDLLVVPALAGVDALWRLQESGAISWQLAERLTGYITLRASGRTDTLPARTRQRRERELRQVGLVIADDRTADTRAVPLGRYLQALVDAWDGRQP
jgi:hypothetical protein